MKTSTVHIKNPSKDLLSFVRELRERKDLNKAKLLEKKEAFFSK